MSVSSPIGKYSWRKFFESNELGQKLFKSFPKISWLNCKGFDFRIVLRLSSTVLNCSQSLHMCTHGYTYTYTYIWVVFPRTGKMSKICHNFFSLELYCDQTVLFFQVFSIVLKSLCALQSKNTFVLVLSFFFYL